MSSDPSRKLEDAAALIHEDARIMGKTIADQLREEAYKKGLARGAVRGVAEGVATGTVELLLRLVRKRFGRIPPIAEERIRGADLYTLDEWADRILTATTIDELFA